MVKKFFRNLFKKEDQSSPKEVDMDKSKSTPEQHEQVDEAPDHFLEEDLMSSPSGEEIQFHHIEDEIDTSIIDDDIGSSIVDNDIGSSTNEEFDTSIIDDLSDSKSEDLPDLPPEVIKALEEAESGSIPTLNKFEEEEEEEEEEFNFTEIKPRSSSSEKTEKNDHQTQQGQAQEETNEELEGQDNFEFSELKVDLPQNEQQNIFKRIKNKVESLIRKRHYEKHHNGAGSDKNIEDSNGPFSPSFKSNAHQLFVTSLVFISSFQSGKIVAYLLKPKNAGINTSKAKAVSLNLSTNKSRIKSIEDLNAFDALLTSKRPEQQKGPKKPKVVIDETKVCESSNKKSSLPINIETIIVLQDRVKSIASVQMRNKKESYFREGDKVDRLAIIGAILQDKIVVRNLENGNCEYISAPQLRYKKSSNKFSKVKIHSPNKAAEFTPTDPNIKVEGNNYKIDSSIRDDLLENITDVLSQARAIQIKNSDGSISFKIVEITPGSIYSKLNIQENDVIKKINGEPITNLNEIMSLFGRIKDLKNLDLGIERDGIENEFEYSFE